MWPSFKVGNFGRYTPDSCMCLSKVSEHSNLLDFFVPQWYVYSEGLIPPLLRWSVTPSSDRADKGVN